LSNRTTLCSSKGRHPTRRGVGAADEGYFGIDLTALLQQHIAAFGTGRTTWPGGE
jgi:hypothetical protein